MRDFTQIGKPEEKNLKAAAPLEKSRQIVARALYASALMFAVAGAWLLVGKQDFFPPQTASLLAFVFIVTALMDVAAVAVLKKVWSRRNPEQ